MAGRRSKSFKFDLAGDLTIRSISDVRLQIIEMLREHASVTACVAADATIDLTFVQLMESARRAAREGGRSLRLGGAATGPLLEVLERGGFLTGADAERREFWLMTTEDR